MKLSKAQENVPVSSHRRQKAVHPGPIKRPEHSTGRLHALVVHNRRVSPPATIEGPLPFGPALPVLHGRRTDRPASATGQETSLPAHWKQGVLVIDAQDRLTWIGKRVRPDQLGEVDLALYQDAGDGLQLRPDP